MKIAAVIATVLSLLPSIKASSLAAAAGINKGQLSAFLNKNGPLADEKQGDLVHYLLEQLHTIKLDYTNGRKLSKLIGQLEQFEPYRINWCEPDPRSSPILFGQPCYIEREVEQDILAYLNRRPFVVGIIGGPKTGKTSVAYRVKMEMSKEGVVIYLDCKHYASSGITHLVEWLFQTTAMQLDRDFDYHPADWLEVVDWLKRDVLQEKEACTFIFDHMEALGNTAVELSSGWHYVLNQTRDEPALKVLGLVLVYDPAAQKLHDSMYHSSRLVQRARFFVPGNYTEGQVDRLLRQVLATDTQPFGDSQLTKQVWGLFRGHPFLTHLYTHIYGNHPVGDAERFALAGVAAAFVADIVPALQMNLYIKELKTYFGGPAISATSTLIEMKSPQGSSVLLQDTGLFFERGFRDDARLFCTPWAQAMLMTVFSEGK